MTSKERELQGVCADVSMPQPDEAIAESPVAPFPGEPKLLDGTKAEGLYWGTSTVVDSVITTKFHSA